MTELLVLPARRGKAIRLEAGRCVEIVNVHGQQVVDTWALLADEPGEALSMEHTRSCLDKLAPGVGDLLYTNRRRPILHFEADTSPGVHDTLLSACDEDRYRLLGFHGHHGNCTENFYLALAALDVHPVQIRSPWNVFENVVIGRDGALSIAPPVSRPGDSVTLRAVCDCIVVFSACPMDIAPTNGADRTPRDVHLRLS